MEAFSGASELLAKLDIVVDLAVENDVEAPICAGHGLPAGLAQIDDRQAAMHETEPQRLVRLDGACAQWRAVPAPQEVAAVVRPAMMEDTAHASHGAGIDALTVAHDHTCNAAHSCRSAILCHAAGHFRHTHEFQKIAQDAKPDLAALLWMELRPIDIPDAQGRRDAPAVIMAIAQPIVLLRRLRSEGMNEIAGRALRDAVEDGPLPLRPLARFCELAPTDMRYLMVRSTRSCGRNCAHPARHHAESGMLAELFADLYQHLHADAYAEQRTTAADEIKNRSRESPALELAHAVAESADAGQHYPLGRRDAVSRAGQLDGRSARFECAADAQQVADPVIDHHHPGCHGRRTGIPAARAALRMSANEQRL